VYRITQQLEKQQAEQEFKNWSTELQSITTDINLSIDPTSEAGIKIAKKLMDHGHLRKCTLNILARISQKDDSAVRQAWDPLLQEMYDNAQIPKIDLYRLLLTDPEINEKAKKWLKDSKSYG